MAKGFILGGEDQAEKTKQPKKTIKESVDFDNFFGPQTMFANPSELQALASDKKVLISGENGTGKTSLALSLATNDLKDNEIIFYIDIDNSGHEIIKELFYKNYHQIKYFRPYVTKSMADGTIIRDEEGIVNKTRQFAQTIRQHMTNGLLVCKDCGAQIYNTEFDEENNNRLLQIIDDNKKYQKEKQTNENIVIPEPIEPIVIYKKSKKVCPYCGKQHLEELHIKAVILDGISFLLEFCESAMRLDKNLAADSGVQMGMWKVRNKIFRDCIDAYMSLNTAIFFLSHEDFIPELQEKFASVKQRLIDEVSMRIVLHQAASKVNENVLDYIAIIRKNRSDLTLQNNSYIFMSVNEKTKNIDTDYNELGIAIFSLNTANKREE